MQKKGKQTEKHKTHIKTPDFYKFYADRYFREYKEGRSNGVIDKESPFYVDYQTYCKVIDSFNSQLRDLILLENFEYIMPARMGVLGIRKRRLTPWFDEENNLINPLPPDWKATLDLWKVDPQAKKEKKLVRHFNKHTKGFVMRWYYSKRTATFKWKSAYAFIPCRTSKKKLGALLKDKNSTVDYFLI